MGEAGYNPNYMSPTKQEHNTLFERHSSIITNMFSRTLSHDTIQVTEFGTVALFSGLFREKLQFMKGGIVYSNKKEVFMCQSSYRARNDTSMEMGMYRMNRSCRDMCSWLQQQCLEPLFRGPGF
jgi:hypothetical protein